MTIERVGPLTWAQHVFWLQNEPAMPEAWRTVPTLIRRLRVPAGTTVARLRQVLSEYVMMFEALRTIYARPGSHPPEQRVLAHYEPPILEVEEAPHIPFRITDKPSIRCVVRRSGELVRSAEIRANMIDVDGYSISSVQQLIDRHLAYGPDRERAGRAARLHPVDLARQESSTWYARLDQRGARWVRELRQRTPRNFVPIVRDPTTRPSTQQSTLESPRLLLGVERLAGLCGVSAATVFHAMISVALVAWLDRRDVYLTTAVADRWRPDTRHMIGRIASQVPCHVEVDPSHRAIELFKRTHQNLLRAYLHGPRDIGASVIEGVQADVAYGSVLGTPIFIEYLEFLRHDPAKHHTLLAHRLHTKVADGSMDGIRFEVSPVWPGVEIVLITDTALLSLREAARLLNIVSNLLHYVARHPDVRVDHLLRSVTIRPRIDGEEWIVFRESRFSATRIRRRLLEFTGVDAVALFGVGEESGIRAYLAGAGIDLAALHEHMLVAASTDGLIRVPAVYRTVATAPGNTGGESTWRAAGITGQLVPATEYRRTLHDDVRVRAIVTALRECNPGNPCEPSRSYAELGGQYVMIPGMLAQLRAAGYDGVTSADLLGLSPLAAVARRLRPAASPHTAGAPVPISGPMWP
jgi:condensation domain-containing protein